MNTVPTDIGLSGLSPRSEESALGSEDDCVQKEVEEGYRGEGEAWDHEVCCICKEGFDAFYEGRCRFLDYVGIRVLFKLNEFLTWFHLLSLRVLWH